MEKRTFIHNQKLEKALFILAFLAIPFLLLATFSFYPTGKLIQLSLTNWKGLGPYDYIGMQNYQELFQSGDFLQILANVFAYVIIAVFQVYFALFLAIVLNGNIKGSKVFKSCIFLPYMLNGVAVAFMFNIMYNYESGPFNVLLRAMGLGQFAVHWISASYMTNFSLGLIALWRYTGFNMVVFLGGLQSISPELYEAASIDGASFLQKARFITLPSIKTTFEINLLLGLNGALQAYFEPFIITKGGPNGITETFITKSLKYAFDFQNFGLASALAVLLIVMILFVMGISKLLVARKGGE